MAALAVTYYAFPSWQLLTWAAVGLAGVAAVVLGVLRNRPRRPVPWLLLAGALLCLDAGDTGYNVLTSRLGFTNAVYLLGYFPLAAAGLLRLARARTGQ